MTGQRDRKARDAIRGSGADLPAVRPNDGTCDGEPQSRTFSVTCALAAAAMEAIEDALDLIGRDRIAHIAHGKADAGGICFDGDRDLAADHHYARMPRMAVHGPLLVGAEAAAQQGKLAALEAMASPMRVGIL